MLYPYTLDAVLTRERVVRPRGSRRRVCMGSLVYFEQTVRSSWRRDVWPRPWKQAEPSTGPEFA